MDIETISRFEEEKAAFFYIPDLSGFTEFINKTDLHESKELIHDLLESILDSNMLNLKVAEILGDAVVFYTTDKVPNLRLLSIQAKHTFIEFQKALKALESKNMFSKELENLSLKIIVHYGEVASTEIKGIHKLIGSDLTLAYKILKNNIKNKEYLMMTDKYLQTQSKQALEKAFPWSPIKSGITTYDSFGEIEYKYVSLAPLLSEIEKIANL